MGMLASMADTPAQTILTVQEGLGRLVIFDAANPLRRTTIALGEKPHEIEVSDDGLTAFVSNFGLLEVDHQAGTPGTTLSVIGVPSRKEGNRFHLPPNSSTAPHGLKLRPQAKRELFTNAEKGGDRMIVFDAGQGTVLRTFALPDGVHNFVFDRTGENLYAFSTRGFVYRLDPQDGHVLRQLDGISPRGLAWTAEQRQLIASGRGELLLLNPSDLTVQRRFANLTPGQIFYPTATPDGRWILAPAVLDGVVLVIDAATGSVAHRVATGSPLSVCLDSAEPNRIAWISNVLVPAGMFGPSTIPKPGGVTRLDLNTLEIRPVPELADANGLAVIR